MRLRARKRIALGALAALLLPLSSQVVAQTPPEPPVVISPLEIDPERNGINLNTGKIDLDVPSLGVPAAPRLRWDKVQNSAPYMRGTINTGSGQQMPVASYSVTTTAGSSESFQCLDWDCTSVSFSGSTFLATGAQHQNGHYQRAGSGETYHFTLLSGNTIASGIRNVQSYASRIDYADGEVITFTYDSTSCGLGTCYRPTRIETNVGYFITIDYQSNDIANMGWGVPFHARLYAASDPNTPLQSLTYNSTATTVTDIGGRIWTITGGNNGLGLQVETVVGSIQLPTEGSNAVAISVAPNASLVGSFVRDGVNWTYAYTSPSPNPYLPGAYIYSKLTVTGPNGYSMAYNMFQGPIAEQYTNYVGSQTDALNRITTFGYDSSHGNRLNRITLPEGNKVDLSYDDCSNIITKTATAKPGSGLANIVESATYPSNGIPENPCPNVNYSRPTSYTDARGKVTNYSWNSSGQLIQQLDPANAAGVRRETDNTYTLTGTLSRKTLGRVCGQTTTCAGNAENHTEYTYFGNTLLPATVTEKDEATGVSRTTTYSYDSAGRVLSVQGPQNGVSGTKYFRYDIYGRKTWEIGAADANNLRMARRFTYRDSDDQVTKVETGAVTCLTDCKTDPLTLTPLEQTDTVYDSRRYPIREATSAGGINHRVTDHAFLNRGLVECTTVRMNLEGLPAPTATSACTLGSQGPDRITRNVYDNAGQLLKIQKAYGVTTANGFPATLQQDYVTYTYTLNGKQQFITDANGNKAQYTWDGFDRLSKWNLPSPTTPGTVSATDLEQYTYDAAGNRLSLKRRDGRTLTYTYDNLNRMLSKLIPDGCPPIQPPGTGCPAPSATRDVFYSYDILGRQLTVRFDSQVGADGIAISYDVFDNVISSTIAMSGFSKSICLPNPPGPSCQYDADNNRTQVTVDGQTFVYSYDARDRPTQIAELGQLEMIGYSYDEFGRPSLLDRRNSRDTIYEYDPISRPNVLINTSYGSPADVRFDYGYNPASQITSQTRINDSYAFTGMTTTNKAYAVNGLNEYTAVAGAGHTYDANANLTGDGTNAYIYDGENRLVSATAAGQTATLTYDPLGRLWQVVKGTANTRFLYDGDTIVAEYDGAGAMTNRYVHGPNAAADDPIVAYVGSGIGTRRFLETDDQGSVILIADNAGATIATNRYDEYGVPQAGNQGRFQYTGQIWLSELGLYHYKARLYSPTLGRFLQVDPIGYEDQINLYAYGGNDPANTTDPAGNHVIYKRSGNVISLIWINAYYGPGNTAEARYKSRWGIEKYWNVDTGKYRVRARVVVYTFKPGTQPNRLDEIRHPDWNFIYVPRTQMGRATVVGGRKATIGANKDAWVSAHECGGHCAYLPDLPPDDPDYSYDIMGGWGNPVTDRAIEELIRIQEGRPKPRPKRKAKEPSRNDGRTINGCPANSAQPLVCGTDIDIWE